MAPIAKINKARDERVFTLVIHANMQDFEQRNDATHEIALIMEQVKLLAKQDPEIKKALKGP